MGYTWEDYTSKLDTNIFYSYELCCPETRFGVIYPDRKLILIGAISAETLDELDIYELKWPLEKVTYYDNINSTEDVNIIMDMFTDPLISEGFVLIDKDFNRVNIKILNM